MLNHCGKINRMDGNYSKEPLSVYIYIYAIIRKEIYIYTIIKKIDLTTKRI